MINKILKIIFPKTCVLCDKIYKNWICPSCYQSIKKEIKMMQIKYKKSNIYFMSFYEGKIRKLLLEYKFKDKAYISNFFTEIMEKDKKFQKQLKNYDYIIAVPMYYIKQKERGYNQAELLAEKIQEKFETRYLKNCLVKIKNNKKQSTLTEKERKENVKNVYKLEKDIFQKRILLIDDIYTTGSTVKACIKELKKGKPKTIDIFVIAKRN